MKKKRKEDFEKVSTKSCPSCGNRALLRLSSLNLKLCTDCNTKIPWYKEETEEDFI